MSNNLRSNTWYIVFGFCFGFFVIAGWAAFSLYYALSA